MKKTIALIIINLILSTSCTAAGIPAISKTALPAQKYPLQVWSVTPTWGHLDATDINIFGMGFEPGARAFVGDKECLDTIVRRQSLIHCRLDHPGENGYGDQSITVRNPDGTTRPIKYTEEQMEAHRRQAIEDDEDPNQVSDGLLYFYYVKPMGQRE